MPHREPLRLTRLAGPAAEPLTLADLKAHLRIDGNDEDDVLVPIIRGAREVCERFTGRALLTQTWRLVRDAWPRKGAGEPWWDGIVEGVVSELAGGARPLVLPKPPLQSVTEIRVFDENDVASVIDPQDYIVDGASEPGRVVLRAAVSVPSPGRAAAGIEVDFVAGYGAASWAVPQPLVHGMRMLAAQLFENRGDGASAALGASGATAHWQPFRVVGLA